jgi:hypothetical protein
MAFPTTSVLDNFDRANGADLGANWDFAFSFGNSSNIFSIENTSRAVPSGNHYAEEVYTAGTDVTESEVYVTLVTAPASGADYGLIARYTGTGGSSQGYRLTIVHNTGAWSVKRVTSGTTQSGDKATATQAVAAGDSFGMEVTGTGATVTIKIYYKASGGSWNLLATGSDTDGGRITGAGDVGMYMFRSSGTGGALDDFGGGEIITATTPGPKLRTVQSNLRW